jgi:hypothetical protein
MGGVKYSDLRKPVSHCSEAWTFPTPDPSWEKLDEHVHHINMGARRWTGN